MKLLLFVVVNNFSYVTAEEVRNKQKDFWNQQNLKNTEISSMPQTILGNSKGGRVLVFFKNQTKKLQKN